jgi:hypothetical protein
MKGFIFVVVGALAAGTAAIAQTAMNHAARQPKPSASTQAAVAPPAQEFPTPLIQQPPSQADIHSSPDSLTIKASNASLTQTLQRIADKTGMQLEGVSGDERVFGSFGPGAPRDVLTALLNGTSYNMIMVGSLENGAPRQLLLSAKSNAAPAITAPTPPPPAADDDTSEVPQDDPPQPMPMPPPGRPLMGQGPGGQPRNPQDMLQQMRQQQMQQNQQNQPQ